MYDVLNDKCAVCKVSDLSTTDQFFIKEDRIVILVNCPNFENTDVTFEFNPQINVLRISGSHRRGDEKTAIYTLDKTFKFNSSISGLYTYTIVNGILKVVLLINNNVHFTHLGDGKCTMQ